MATRTAAAFFVLWTTTTTTTTTSLYNSGITATTTSTSSSMGGVVEAFHLSSITNIASRNNKNSNNNNHNRRHYHSNPLSAATRNVFPSRNSNRNNYSSSSSSNNKKNNNKLRNKQKMKPMPLTGYDAKAIEEYYDMRPLQVGWRLNSLGLPLLVWYGRLLMDQTMGVLDKPSVQRQRGKELRQAFVRSKSVALIKSGQALSLRPDLLKNKVWAEELGKLVDAVGPFPDVQAMNIIKSELNDLLPTLQQTKSRWFNDETYKKRQRNAVTPLQKMTAKDPILSLFEFDNSNMAVASASIGQVYKAKIRKGPQLEAAIGKDMASLWGGKTVAIKVQRPDVTSSASLDMYLIRRTALWLSKMRAGNIVAIADQFGMQLFGELDYIREANNCQRFRALYGEWDNVRVPDVCLPLTRKRVLVQEWIDGEKGPWPGDDGIKMVRIGLKCSVDQLMTTGLFHADPHRGNLLKTPDGKLAFIDFGMMADIDEEDRYGLFGLSIGLQSKDLPLITENLLKLRFLEDTTQIDKLVPRLRAALLNSTGGTGKASDVNFSRLQAELDNISRENVLHFSTPPFFTIIIRSLTILEGVALSVDPRFRLVRGSYPYVLRQLLVPEDDDRTPAALQRLLVRLLTVNGEGKEIEWERLRDLLRLAQKARSTYNPAQEDGEDDETSATLSRQTIELFFKFLTSKTGLFLKRPLVHELAEAIDGMASIGEGNLLQATNGLLPPLPGMNGPVNRRVMNEMGMMLDTFRNAMTVDNGNGVESRLLVMRQLLDELRFVLTNERLREDAEPLLQEVRSVIQMVAVEVLEIRGSRAMRAILQSAPPLPLPNPNGFLGSSNNR
ncbi:ABC1 family-domain containing protein [Nitzschia inconspicua]|uniref:ABC1 family-domain containing protein n=1 Tax=Nitzschia inconspicua TaxID=303405 RepID=A0A9K3LK42_9STRA|nr:ABC1 family-domain containing protein [Nitzschia inconspicua]